MKLARIAETSLWTFVAGALGAIVAIPLDITVWKAAVVAGTADLVPYWLRLAERRRQQLSGQV